MFRKIDLYQVSFFYVKNRIIEQGHKFAVYGTFLQKETAHSLRL